MKYHYSGFMRSMPVDGVIFHLDKATALAECVINYRLKTGEDGEPVQELPYCCAINILNDSGQCLFMYAAIFAEKPPQNLEIIRTNSGQPVASELKWLRVHDINLGEFDSGLISACDIRNYEVLIEDFDKMTGEYHL